MNILSNAINLPIKFDSLTPSDAELNAVCQRCLAFLDMPSGALEEAGELFLLSKADDRYVVLYYFWLDSYRPRFIEIDGDSIKQWEDKQAVEFVLNFAQNHTNERLTSFDYHGKQSFIAREAISYFFEIVNEMIEQSLPEEERNTIYREYMQAIMFCLYNYDFLSNVKRSNYYYNAEQLPTGSPINEPEVVLAHYER